MAARFRETGGDSFWGNFVYDQVVPNTHFLRQLADLIDWEDLTVGLADLYKGGGEYGAVPYRPSVLLKMLVVSYLYKLSERETELFVSDSLAARYFLGIAANERVPDHSSLSVFRERILEKGGIEAYEELFKRIVRLAKEKGIKFGRIQVVDATHSIADVDTKKDKDRRDKDGKPRDGGASWGSKGRRKIKTVDGKTVETNKSFYGYKAHVSLNAESGIITSVVTTTGKLTDGKQFPSLVQKDEEVGIEAEVYAGDKGYDDVDNHGLLEEKGKKSALILNKYRTEKKDRNKQRWIELKSSEDYQAGKKERYKIEQKFGEGKRSHGWGRCRYLGLQKFSVQSFLTAIVLNLKRIVCLISGRALRGPVTSAARA
jgi:IS5 family transposase